jgi:antitoxin (DNA-binding transcriptional repressor) of toxin-antitoxin stability system
MGSRRDYHRVVTEMPLPEDDELATVAREAAASGEVVYLTDRGQRLAAIVPAALAELLERARPSSGRRSLGARAAGRSGQNDISERIEEIFRREVTP